MSNPIAQAIAQNAPQAPVGSATNPHKEAMPNATMQDALGTPASKETPPPAPKADLSPAPTGDAPKPSPQDLKFAALTKRERQLVQEREAFKAKEARLQELEAIAAKYADLEKLTPMQRLERVGLNYEDLTNDIINNNIEAEPAYVKALRKEMEALKTAQEARDKQNEESGRTLAEEQKAKAVEAFKADIAKTVEAEADKYELISMYDAQDLVYDTVESYHEAHGKVLSASEACDLVEEYLALEAKKALAAKKFKAQEAPKASEAPAENGFGQSRTLAQTSSVPSMLNPATESDRLKRAMAALDGTRK